VCNNAYKQCGPRSRVYNIVMNSAGHADWCTNIAHKQCCSKMVRATLTQPQERSHTKGCAASLTDSSAGHAQGCTTLPTKSAGHAHGYTTSPLNSAGNAHGCTTFTDSAGHTHVRTTSLTNSAGYVGGCTISLMNSACYAHGCTSSLMNSAGHDKRGVLHRS
jgi:hypothetical protein